MSGAANRRSSRKTLHLANQYVEQSRQNKIMAVQPKTFAGRPLAKALVVKTIILDDKTTGKTAMQCCTGEREAKVGAGVWKWWTDGSFAYNGRVGATAVCNHGTDWRTRHRYLGTQHIEVIDAKLWSFGLALRDKVK